MLVHEPGFFYLGEFVEFTTRTQTITSSTLHLIRQSYFRTRLHRNYQGIREAINHLKNLVSLNEYRVQRDRFQRKFSTVLGK